MIRFSVSIQPVVAKLWGQPAAWIDFHLRPQLRERWGGPFNGQRHRQQIFLDLLRRCPFKAVVETGTFRGSTTEFMALESGLPVFSVESNPRYYHYAALRLRSVPRVGLALGDSRAFLEQLSADPTVPKSSVFFYLDAHWYRHLPLMHELRVIIRGWTEPVIMIDDFQVPDDPGYGYNDYSADNRLCLDYLSPLAHFKYEAFFPSLPSGRETGRRRGCVVLVSRSVANRVDRVDSLRRWVTESSILARTTRPASPTRPD